MQQSQTRHLSLSTAAKRVRCAVSGFALLCTAAGFAQDAPTSMPTRIMGTILESNGKTLTLRTSEEPSVTLRLDPKVRIVDQKPAHLGDVTANSFVGVTAVEEADGKLHAREIHIFPEDMRGTGEGHYPMGAANTTMTNGNVTTMTNGSVSAPAVRSGKIGQLSVEYKGGHSEIAVDADVPVTQLSRGNPSLLRPGVPVMAFIRHGTDGGAIAINVTVMPAAPK